MPEQRFRTTALRTLWAGYRCLRGSWSYPKFYGMPIGGCPSPAVDAYRALERALMSEGYKASAVWSYVCRNIVSSGLPSLHGYGIAIDIDWTQNPQTWGGDPFSGKLKKNHVDAVMGIKLSNGENLWWWGGYWTGLTQVDRMHFQLDCSPSEALTIDWSTVPGEVTIPPEPEPIPPPPIDPWEEWWDMLSEKKKVALDAMSDKAFEEMTQSWTKLVDNPPDGKPGNQNSMYNVVRFYRVIAERGGQDTGTPSKVANQVVIKE